MQMSIIKITKDFVNFLLEQIPKRKKLQTQIKMFVHSNDVKY